MGNEPYIRASDIGTHAFCPRALYLKDQGAPSTLGEARQAGVYYHDTHGATIRAARRRRFRIVLMIIAGIVLLALASLTR